MDEGQKDLVQQSYTLLEIFQQPLQQGSGQATFQLPNKLVEFHDYAFVVFPMAKAYEGFLKKCFYEGGLIDQVTYEGHKFRLGKALNPDLPERHRGDWWMYGELSRRCGREVASQLWMAWKECRNLLFHFFPAHKHFIILEEANDRLMQLNTVMTMVMECNLVGLA